MGVLTRLVIVRYAHWQYPMSHKLDTKARSASLISFYRLMGLGLVGFLIGGSIVYILLVCVILYGVVKVFRGSIATPIIAWILAVILVLTRSYREILYWGFVTFSGRTPESDVGVTQMVEWIPNKLNAMEAKYFPYSGTGFDPKDALKFVLLRGVCFAYDCFAYYKRVSPTTASCTDALR